MELRSYQVDNLRAIAIILVVLGHSIILYDTGWDLFKTEVEVPALDVLKSWIDLIQMPLFISLSGYLFFYSKKTSFFLLVVKKVKRLLFPFLCFGLLWMIPIRKCVGYSGYSGKSLFYIIINGLILGEDCGHLWFLPFLFMTFIFAFVQISVLNKLKIVSWKMRLILLLIGYAMYLAWWRIPINFPGGVLIRNMFIYYFWFIVGYAIGAHSDIIKKMGLKLTFIAAILAVVTSVLYLVNIEPYMIIPRFFLLLFCFSLPLYSENIYLKFLSENSFGIYLFHSPMIYITFALIPNANPAIVIGANFIVFGGIAYCLILLLRKMNLEICIGE